MSELPRSVRDYERFVATLKENFPLDEAMSHAVGGDYDGVGRIERAILEHFGLEAGMALIDVGCGSGRLASALSDMDVDYLGTDVVADLLDYAAANASPRFQFKRHLELTVPAPSHSIDVICAFSVFTHLPHHESYLYMEDMLRALKPGGMLVFSFLEFAMPEHWRAFADTLTMCRNGALPHLNQFIERNQIAAWSDKLGFQGLEFVDGDKAPWGGRALGQSVAVLRKERLRDVRPAAAAHNSLSPRQSAVKVQPAAASARVVDVRAGNEAVPKDLSRDGDPAPRTASRPMIISIHVAKTAGTSFGEALKREFKERFMHDDEDWAGYRAPEADARRAANAARMRSRRDEILERFDVIHGHFVPEKFSGLFPRAEFVTFLRDPIQQSISHYEFLRRIPHIDHPAVREFHAARMTVEDFVAWEATKNQQTQMMGAFSLDDFAMIGLTEEFARSIALFNVTFGLNLSADIFLNANPAREKSDYQVSAALRKHIELHRAEDIDLYNRARALFERQTSRRGIFAIAGSAPKLEFGVLDVPIDPVKADLVSAAIERYNLKSIIDVGACWGVNGGYTFHALKSGRIEQAIIVDGDVTSLTRDRARNDARIQLFEGDIGDASFVETLPLSDAAIMFDVLLHQVSPDWDKFLVSYSRKVSHFVIWNPDWIGSDVSVRYVEGGLDWYLDNVGEADQERVAQWFERHDETSVRFSRPWRDVHYFWQWGVTSADVIAKMRELGFTLDYFNNAGIW